MSDDHSIGLEEQERDEILEEIDELVANNRLPVTGNIDKLKPKKRGIGFPLVINLFAIAAVVSTFYFANHLFEQRQETLSIENTAYKSAEGKLLEELKRESAAKLEQKDEEIGAIQNELAELDRQSRELAESMDQQIADREAQLRLALEAELENERIKLRSEGKSESDIEAEINAIEARRSAEYETELAAFRNETEQAIAAKEEELARAKQINEELLAEVNSEKARIENETQKRENELTEQFEIEKAALAEEAANAEAALERLSKDREREILIIDQINGSYEAILNNLDNGESEEAIKQIEALKELIEDPNVATLKAVSERSRNDQKILELLRQKIEEQAYKEDTATQSLAQAADLLLSAQEIAGLGTEAYQSGKFNEAEEYYTRSLQKIPALRQAWQNLEAISKNAEAERLNSLVQKATSLADSGDYGAAIQQFEAAAGSANTFNPELLSKAVSGLTASHQEENINQLAAKDTALKSLESSKTAEIEELKRSLDELKTEYAAQLTEARSTASEQKTTQEEEIERLTRLIGERDQENLRINSEKIDVEEKLASAVASYEEKIKTIQTEIDELNIALSGSGSEYEKLKSELTQEKESLGSKLRASEITGYNNGIKQGRTEAMEDILVLTSYLSGTSSSESNAQAKITKLAEEDPLYQQAVQKIQDIAARGGTEVGLVAQSILIGTISFASGSQIIIEPLTDLKIENGSKVNIMRKERGQDEYYITYGIVTSVEENKIVARTDPAGRIPARSMDLVYITAE